MRKKTVFVWILFTTSFIGISYGIDTSLLPSIFTLTNKVSVDEQQYQTQYKTQIINQYCKNALSADGAFLYTGTVSTGTQFYFSSKNSLFLRALCATRTSDAEMKELTKDLFKENFAKKLTLQQFKGNQDLCSPGTGSAQNQCDLARYTSKIYLALMSDIFKIKQAEILQVSSLESFKSKEDRIARIFETYFHKNEAERNSYQKDFPKTATMIDNNQKILYKTLQFLVLLDNEKILKQSQESKVCTLTGESVSDFTCWLHLSEDQTKGLNKHFTNFVVNEYLNYRFFTDFYTYWLQEIINTQTIEGRIPYLLEMESILQQRDLFETALKSSLHDLQQTAITYPLHIGLVLYQEELLRFRDQYAAKLVTPFYTLYEKLRNVQCPAA